MTITVRGFVAIAVLAAGLLGTTPAQAQGPSPQAQYLIHVRGVSVHFEFSASPIDGLRGYMYTLSSRTIVSGSDYIIYIDRASPATVRMETTGGVKDAWSYYDGRCGQDPIAPCPLVYRHMVWHGHPFDMTSVQRLDSGVTRCDLVYGAIHGSNGFRLELIARGTCAAATRAATPVVDALLTKMS